MHYCGLRGEINFRRIGSDPGFELGNPIFQTPCFFNPGKDLSELIGGARFGKVIKCPTPHRFHGGLDGGVSRHQNHSDPWRESEDFVE